MRDSFLFPIAILLGQTLLGCSDGNIYPFPKQENRVDTTVTTDSAPFDNSDPLDSGDTAQETDRETNAHFTVGRQAEDYDTSDSKGSNRVWYIIPEENTNHLADPDETPAETANEGAYLEALPDLLVDVSDPDNDGDGLSTNPSLGPMVGYWVNLDITGRYYVWVRAHPSSTRDNAIHVGIDDNWPETGANIQFLGDPDQGWVWSSNQRDSLDKYGIPLTIYLDVDTTGRHLITFSMREDGFEFDEWIMTTNPDYVPVP